MTKDELMNISYIASQIQQASLSAMATLQMNDGEAWISGRRSERIIEDSIKILYDNVIRYKTVKPI